MKRSLSWLLLVLMMNGALAAQPASGAQPLSTVTTLEPGRAIEKQLGGGQSHEYALSLESGQYAKISLEQLRINVAVAVVAPEGGILYSADNTSAGEPEIAEVVATTSGEYRIRVSAVEPHAAVGEYSIVVSDLTAATGQHRLRADAARAFAAGTTEYRHEARDNLLRAISSYEKAQSAWRNVADDVEEARTLVAIGFAYMSLGEKQKALDAMAPALPIARRSADPKALARVLECTGEIYNTFGERNKSVDYYQEALTLWRAAGARAAEARTLSSLGVALSGTGQRRKALEVYDQSVKILRDLQDRRTLAEVLGNIGVAYDNLGEYQRALDKHLQMLDVVRETSDRESESIAQNNIGSVYAGLGQYQKALDAYNAALEINRALDGRMNVAINLNNIAWVYANLGDRRRALRFYQESLDISRAINDRRRIAITLHNIANIHTELSDYSTAIALHNEGLPIRRAIGDRDGEAISLNNLGDAYAKLGEKQKAREHFEQALTIHRQTGNRHMLARALRNLGALLAAGGEADNGLTLLNEALRISRDIRDQKGEAAALADVARAERNCGSLAEARKHAAEGLAALESVRLAVVSPSLRASVFAAARDLHELYIDILMRLHAEDPRKGFDAAALQASEGARARSLLELLSEAGTEIRRGVDARLLARERELQQLLSAKAEQQVRLLSGKHNQEDASAAANELDGLSAELEQIQSRIREASPEYAALTQPSPLTANDIQRRVLDDHTVLLEYQLGSERSFLWIVSRTALHTFELPPRAEIDAAAQNVYKQLTARNVKPPHEAPAARALRIARADEEYRAAAATISSMLLRNAAPLIAGKRLLIVAEGALHYLPFTALPEPDTGVPMAVNHEIAVAPSASVLAALRDQIPGRSSAPKGLLVFADPVFSPGDSRVASTDNPATANIQPAIFSNAPRPGRDDFMRLRFSRNEAEEIAKLAPGETTVKALDFDATRDMALSPEVANFRILHFATHSLFNDEHPELSGIVLSRVRRDGSPQNGFLRLYDIYNLRLGADLVVLSACKSALGGEIKGEGLIGLTRGFLYAGAPRVVASLWEIDDRTSAEFMKRFYRAMLVDGRPPAAALRDAQLAMWKSKGWDAAYYWAAFTLHGEWQ